MSITSAVEKVLDGLPPNVKRALAILVLGAAMGGWGVTFEGRVAAAEASAEEAKAQITQANKAVQEIKDTVSTLAAGQVLSNQHIGFIEQAARRTEDQLIRQDQKLDRLLERTR
jgi:hypothetical protein